jgi:hypothetical protein
VIKVVLLRTCLTLYRKDANSAKLSANILLRDFWVTLQHKGMGLVCRGAGTTENGAKCRKPFSHDVVPPIFVSLELKTHLTQALENSL